MKPRAYLVWVAAASSLLGCATMPVMTKAEARARPLDPPVVVLENFLVLARFWDAHAEKSMLDFKSNTFLQVWESEGRAEITIGNGPYYGMIELRRIDERATEMSTFGWGHEQHTIREWAGMIRGAGR